MSHARSVAAVLLFLAAVAVLAPPSRRVEAEPQHNPMPALQTWSKVVTSPDKTADVAKSVGLAPPKLPLVLPAFAPVVGTLDARIRGGYELATKRASELWPGCGLRWTILAGIGSVESANGTHHDGAVVVSDSGLVLPRIVGPPLDGEGGRARIEDTDAGLLDGDASIDHAVGPMQFIPSTWRRHGRDANDDRIADPHSIDDAALAAASYVCAAGDLRDEETLRRALFSYNHSDDYVLAVRYQIEQFDLAFGLLVPASTVSDPQPGTTTTAQLTPPPSTTVPTTTASTTTSIPSTTTSTTTTSTTTSIPSTTTSTTSTTTSTTTAAPTTTTTEAPTTTSAPAEPTTTTTIAP